MEKILEVNGISFRVRVDGPTNAPWLVLINSLSTTLEMWEDQIPAFAGHFQVLRYDQRGHGSTSSPDGPYTIDDLGNDVIGILNALRIDKAFFCGVSLGGMISLWLGAHAKNRVEKIVAACTSANFAPPEFWRDRANLVRRDGVVSLYEGLLSRWFTSEIDKRNPRAKDLLMNMLSTCDQEGYAKVCEALRDADLTDDVKNISCPALIIAGSADPAAPPTKAFYLNQAIANSSLYVISDASHLANLEQPDIFTDIVIEHMVGSAKTRGIKVRREVLSDAHVDRAIANATDFTAPFQDFISRYAWGEIWNRPGLDRKSRSIVTLTTLVALGHLNEFSFHIPAAIRNGLSKNEISEILIQCGIYAGVPAANSAFAKANEILRDIDDVK